MCCPSTGGGVRIAPGVSPTQAATEAGAILQRDDGFPAARGGGALGG